MPDAIDKTAILFAKRTEKIRQAIIVELLGMYKKGGDPVTFASQMLSANFSKHIIKDLGFGADMNSLFAEYDRIAGDVAKTFGSVSSITIDQLKNLDSLFFMEHVRDVGEAMTRQMVYAAYTGITERALQVNLLNATKKLSEAQIGSLTNTALRTFRRATFAATAQELAPKDARFQYDGPNDDKIDEETCGIVMDDPKNTATGYTIEEISALPVDFINGGHWGCRHSWTLITE